jgi:hypothetical protein
MDGRVKPGHDGNMIAVWVHATLRIVGRGMG